jgi:membrane protein DedA with SNARE-associated domain
MVYLTLFAAVVLTGLGLPVPEDAIVLGGGYLAFRRLTALWPTMGVALIGALTGDALLYWGGRRYAQRLAKRIGEARLARARRALDRWGVGAILVGRFVMGLRAAIFVTAGIVELPFRRFLLVNTAGALIGVPLVVWLGYWAGDGVDELAHTLLRVKLVALAVLAVLVAAALLIARARRK